MLPLNRHFPLSPIKDEWDTKEDTGKSMKNARTCCGMPTSRAKATLSSEKIKPIALAVFELRLSEEIS